MFKPIFQRENELGFFLICEVWNETAVGFDTQRAACDENKALEEAGDI